MEAKTAELARLSRQSQEVRLVRDSTSGISFLGSLTPCLACSGPRGRRPCKSRLPSSRLSRTEPLGPCKASALPSSDVGSLTIMYRLAPSHSWSWSPGCCSRVPQGPLLHQGPASWAANVRSKESNPSKHGWLRSSDYGTRCSSLTLHAAMSPCCHHVSLRLQSGHWCWSAA